MSKHSVRGFTLIELLVVFAIAGVLLAVVPSAMGKLSEAVAYRQAVQDISSALRTARQRARLEGIQTAVYFHAQQRSFGVQGKTPIVLGEGIGLEVEAADITRGLDGSQSIWFSPDGGSTGGSIGIVRANASTRTGIRLRVDWLSGLVTQETL